MQSFTAEPHFLRRWTGALQGAKSLDVSVSLRLRLVVLPAIIVLAGLAVLAFFEAQDARARVRAETQSGVQIGRTLAANAIERASSAPDAQTAMRVLEQELPKTVRHIRIQTWPAGVIPLTGRPGPGERSTAPDWFIRWVDVPVVSELHHVPWQGTQIAQIVITTDPTDELHEVWADWRNEMLVLTIVSLIIILIVVSAVTFAFRPLAALANAFDRMEEGDFAVRVPFSADPQLRRLAERFNRMASSLEQAESDNHRLMDSIVAVQEEERKDIARELHDEYGPSLFAIRADLGAISRWVRKKEPRYDEMQERLGSISNLVMQIQRINSRLLERLRPLVLEEMGLQEAIHRLTENWSDRYPKVAFEVEAGEVGELGEAEIHALYRAAQECLTNIVRHADAHKVQVRLLAETERVTLTVQDDGRGVAPGRPAGFGLLGMAERARAAGGGMTIEPAQGRGTRVTVWVQAGAKAA